MCILIHVPEARHFPYQHLHSMLQANGDGAGFVYYHRARQRAVVKRFLTILKPKAQADDFMPDLESREMPGPDGIVESRLAKLNNHRMRKGLAPLSAWEVYQEPSAEKYLEWLCGGSMLKTARVRKAARYNPPKIITFVDEAEVEQALLAIPPDSPLIFHARLCTHGTITMDNVHPFRVPKSRAILAHNGTISGLGVSSSSYAYYSNGYGKSYSESEDESLSDTRELAHKMLAGLSYREIVRARPMIEHIGGWSRFAIMDGASGHVTRMGSWTWEDPKTGVHYSNLNFMPKAAPSNPGIAYAQRTPVVTVVDAPAVVKSPAVEAIDRRIDQLIAEGRLPGSVVPGSTIGVEPEEN